MIYGLLLISIIAVLSFFISHYISIGVVAIAILLSMIVANTRSLDIKYQKGINFAQKSLLSFAIALLGIKLDFSILLSLGFKTIFIIIIGMIITIYSAVIIGKRLGIDAKLSALIGIGNAVCGSSAIAATSPILKANKETIGISVAIVNLLGTVGIFLLPFIAFIFHFNNIDSAILIGNTLQAVGQVTASGFGVNEIVGVGATTVKMGRVLLLTPLVLGLIYFLPKSDGIKTKAKVPLFIIFFIIFSLISSFSLVSDNIQNIIGNISHISLLLAMSGIGLGIRFNGIGSKAKDGLKLAIIVFAIQITLTLGLLWII